MYRLGLTLLALLATNACASYLDFNSYEVDSSEHGTSPGPRGTSCSCGWANKGRTRIVEGRETLVNEFSFMVALIEGNNPTAKFCGGAILTPNHVVTAAHCTVNHVNSGRLMSVLVGDHDVADPWESPFTRIYSLSRIVQHERYENVTHSNDISILVMAQPIAFNTHIGPICMSQQRLGRPNDYVKLIGWGRLTTDIRTNVLQKVNVRLVDGYECSAKYGINSRNWQRNVDPQRQVCVYSKGIINSKGACNGDSGGPGVILDEDTNRFFQIGVMSFVHVCGDEFPTVLTDVSAFFDWIQRVVSSYTPSQMCFKR